MWHQLLSGTFLRDLGKGVNGTNGIMARGVYCSDLGLPFQPAGCGLAKKEKERQVEKKKKKKYSHHPFLASVTTSPCLSLCLRALGCSSLEEQ